MKIIFFLISLFVPATVYGQLLEVPQAGKASTKTFLIEAAMPKAVVLLFIGGDGVLDLKPDGSTTKQNPLNRSAGLWHQMRREGIWVARCSVERLMRRMGIQGARRGKASNQINQLHFDFSARHVI